MGIQVSTSSVQVEAASVDNSSSKSEEISPGDENEKEMTLGDALNQVKGTTLASVEELHSLAGGADIKVCLFTHCMHRVCLFSCFQKKYSLRKR